MREIEFAEGEYYHIFNRGVGKQNIFRDERDKIRFLFLILHLQGDVTFDQIGREVTYYVKHSVFEKQSAEEVLKKRFAEVVSFIMMPNHFHLIVHETKKSGISRFMQKVLNAYTKYWNTKYGKSGHLFQGPFKAVHVESNEQLLYLSAYIHLNPREIGWAGKEHKYHWSSYPDYLGESRWGQLLKSNIVLGQFRKPKEYQQAVERSGAKEAKLHRDILLDHFD